MTPIVTKPYKTLEELSGYTEPSAIRITNDERAERLKLAFQVGALQAFIKYGIPGFSMVKIKDTDLAGYDAAVEVAIKRIEEEAEIHSKR